MKKCEEWYIYNEYDNFLKEINFLYSEYIKKIEHLYKSPDEEAELYRDYLFENPEEYSYIDDIEDVPSEIERLAFDRYLLVRNIKYRYLCSNIIMLYQMLEQFLSSLVRCKISRTMDKKIANEYNNKNIYLNLIIDFYKQYQYDIKENSHYSKIDELRLLENVIKHSSGKSEKDLRKINNKYFKKIPTSYPYDDTIINDNLNIDKEDFKSFVDAINGFILEMPKYLKYYYDD